MRRHVAKSLRDSRIGWAKPLSLSTARTRVGPAKSAT
jgi:hypothetical protein